MKNKQNVIKEYETQSDLYQRFALEIEHLLQRLLIEEGIKCTAITSRLKNRDSLCEKIDRKNDKYKCLAEITDIAGVRVITYYSDDVDKVAGIVEREFVVDRKNSIDKGKALEPDRFGYCSVHYVVEMCEERLKLRENQSFSGLKCEIQIRTVLQHAWAEIEHDLGYKSVSTIPKEVRRKFSRLAGLLELGDKEFQEISNSLITYRNRVANQIKDKEAYGVEIDVVSLETFLESDEGIMELSSRIREVFGWNQRKDIFAGEIEQAIGELAWFDICTIDELQKVVSSNGNYAFEIAEKKAKYKTDSEEGVEVSNTIAIFYLCYSLLLDSECTIERVVEYYDSNGICSSLEERIKGAKNLIAIKEELSSQG